MSFALLGLAVYSAKAFLKGDTPDSAFSRMYIDTNAWQASPLTAKPFPHQSQLGETLPIMTPAGTATGMPAQPCYWTADGGSKKDPDWVLLNSEVGQPEPTFCPFCKRLVVERNPPPSPDRPAPPTRDEWFARHPRPN